MRKADQIQHKLLPTISIRPQALESKSSDRTRPYIFYEYHHQPKMYREPFTHPNQVIVNHERKCSSTAVNSTVVVLLRLGPGNFARFDSEKLGENSEAIFFYFYTTEAVQTRYSAMLLVLPTPCVCFVQHAGVMRQRSGPRNIQTAELFVLC